MGVGIHDGIAARISRSFDQPPETVYAAFTEPDLVAQWMWADPNGDRWAEAHAQGMQAPSDVLTAMWDEQA